MAVSASGTVYSFGNGWFGRLGHGANQLDAQRGGCGFSETTPKRIAAFSSKDKVVSVSAGGYHSLAITASGSVYSFGWWALTTWSW